MSFGKESLEQTGKTYKVNGKIIKARKKTSNKWFETQDSISYWNLFFKPKIIYPETTTGAYFAYDDRGMMLDKTCFMLITNKKFVKYLQATLSSKLFEYAYKNIFSSVELGSNGYQYNKHALVKLPVCKDYRSQDEYDEEYFYSLYGLNADEIMFIESQCNQCIDVPNL